MLENLDITEILKLGFVGIGFLLAALSFLLLRAEQQKDNPRPKMLTPIYVFMAFSLILAGAALFLQTQSSDVVMVEEIAPYKNKLNKVSGLVDAKLLHYLTVESDDQFAKQFAEDWKQEMEDARQKGLID